MRAQAIASSSRRPRILPLVSALLTGILLGLAFPPADAKWLVWVGLVPLLVAIERTQGPRHAFAIGYVAGAAFFLITLYPLVSAHAWTGWSIQTREAFAARMTRQWWFLHGVWVLFAAWGGLFWGTWAALLRRLGRGRPWATLGLTVALWLLIAEWVRAQTTFGFTWSFLGNATADFTAIRQLAALGGLWALSGLVVLVNGALAQLCLRDRFGRGWSVPAGVLGLVAVAWLGGSIATQTTSVSPAMPRVAVLQHYKDAYTLGDFLPIGLDRSYVPMVQEALRGDAELIVLPESIVLGALSLDGTASRTKPPERQMALSEWEQELRSLLAESEAILVLGVDTVEQGRDHNTLVAWTRDGAVGWYHKRRLVPFSEYIPSGWSQVAIRGRSQYSPGEGTQLIRAGGWVFGGFICQEVLIPWVTRQAARDGATVLITGGNDGVFGHPAVARIHADAAQLRAVETGRFVARAMKTGVSALIDPQGRELMRSTSAESVLLFGRMAPRTAQTPYVRFGDWLLWLAALLILVLARSGSDPVRRKA